MIEDRLIAGDTLTLVLVFAVGLVAVLASVAGAIYWWFNRWRL